MTDNNDPQESLYVRIRQWFQPYYQPTPSAASKVSKRKVPSAPAPEPATPARKSTAPELRVFDYPNPLDNAIQFNKKPSANRVW